MGKGTPGEPWQFTSSLTAPSTPSSPPALSFLPPSCFNNHLPSLLFCLGLHLVVLGGYFHFYAWESPPTVLWDHALLGTARDPGLLYAKLCSSPLS